MSNPTVDEICRDLCARLTLAEPDKETDAGEEDGVDQFLSDRDERSSPFERKFNQTINRLFVCESAENGSEAEVEAGHDRRVDGCTGVDSGSPDGKRLNSTGSLTALIKAYVQHGFGRRYFALLAILHGMHCTVKQKVKALSNYPNK